MIDRCEKSHQAENLSSCSYSAFCAYTANTHHAAMMSRIGGCKEATDSAFGMEAAETTARKPAAMVGGCVFAS
jgi:hypothetical protein